MIGQLRRSRLPYRFFACCLCAAAFVAVIAPSSTAAPINYGDFMGVDVWYRGVTEDANSFGDSPPLFGAPTVSGNAIDFNPIGFNAASAGGGVDVTDGQLNFILEAKPGKVIENLLVTEAGDTTLAGNGTDNTMTAVFAEVFLDIVEVDGLPVNGLNFQDDLMFSPSNGDYLFCTDGGCSGVFQTDWNGSLFIDLDQVLTDAGIPFQFGVTELAFVMDNTLLAISETGTNVFIAKKDTDGVVIITNIPEPTTVLLSMLGMMGAAILRRRSLMSHC